jgi:hypothetical protein
MALGCLFYCISHTFGLSERVDRCRPGYQRLFEERWNEDCFFFGATDTFVQAPTRNRHERRLLRETEKGARGLLLGPKETDVPEDEEFREHVYDDEDMFLHNPVVGSMLSLPSLLLHGCKAWQGPSLLFCRVVDHRRAQTQWQYLDFLTTMVYAGDTKLRFRFDALDRCVDPVIGGTDDLVRQRNGAYYFLDYVPMIRCCVLSDRAPKADDEPMEQRAGRRTTRRTGRRPPFLEGLVPSFARQGDNAAHFEAMSVSLHDNALHLVR